MPNGNVWLEPLHLSELSALALVIWLARPAKRLPAAWWIGAGWAMSYADDSWAAYHRGSWASSYPLLAVEMLLVICALRPRWSDRVAAAAVLGALAAVSYRASMPGPDAILTVVGGAAIWWLASASRCPFTAALACYYGGGGIFHITGYFWHVWGLGFSAPLQAEQAFRLAGYGAFGIVLYRQRRATECG